MKEIRKYFFIITYNFVQTKLVTFKQYFTGPVL